MAQQAAELTPGDVAALLRGTAAVIRDELTALPEPLTRWHEAPGEWCVKETLGHLIETERRGFAGRISTILAGDDPQLAGWDAGTVARERRDCERELAALLDEFIALREASIALAAGLQDADLERGGQHPDVGY